jgi:O-antigen ligase
MRRLLKHHEMTGSRTINSASTGLFGARSRTYVLWAFAALVLVAGGSARHDVASLIFLRPLAFMAIAYAVVAAPANRRPAFPAIVWLLCALALLMALQLVPLAWDFWRGLPGRGTAAELAIDAGLAESARAFTLTPARTWNSLFSLSVPAAAFLLYRAAPAEARRRIVLAVVLAGAASVALGLLQLVADSNSWLFMYRVHTEDKAIGFFANRNHQGIFLACVIVYAGVYASQIERGDKAAYLKLTLLGGLVATLVPFILILGSRSGLLLGLAALALVPFLLARSPLVQDFFARMAASKRGPGRRISPRIALFAVFGLAIAGLGALAILNSRGESFSRLSDSGAASPFDRGQVLDYLVRMAGDFFPWGSGFGSFDTVFYQYEPRDALSTVYLNHAHNDWLQFLIEGGLPAALLLAAATLWFAARAVKLWRSRREASAPVRLGMLAVIAFVAIASAVDYPLRVPIMMILLAFSAALVVDEEAFTLTPRSERDPSRRTRGA